MSHLLKSFCIWDGWFVRICINRSWFGNRPQNNSSCFHNFIIIIFRYCLDLQSGFFCCWIMTRLSEMQHERSDCRLWNNQIWFSSTSGSDTNWVYWGLNIWSGSHRLLWEPQETLSLFLWLFFCWDKTSLPPPAEEPKPFREVLQCRSGQRGSADEGRVRIPPEMQEPLVNLGFL